MENVDMTHHEASGFIRAYSGEIVKERSIVSSGIARIDNFLLNAEHCGCHTLDANVHRLASILHDLIRIKEHSLYPSLTEVGWNDQVEHLHEEDQWAEERLHDVLELMGEANQERLDTNYDKVQAILEELLPSLRGHMHELSDEVVPHLLEKMKPGQADALADAIRATQQMFIDEENSKKAAAAAAYLKTRAGRRAAILEMAIKEEDERRKKGLPILGEEPVDLTKKQKKAKKEGTDEPTPRGRYGGMFAKLSVKERREQRDKWHREHVVNRKEALAAANAPATHTHDGKPCRGHCAHARSNSPKPKASPTASNASGSEELKALLRTTTTSASAKVQ